MGTHENGTFYVNSFINPCSFIRTTKTDRMYQNPNAIHCITVLILRLHFGLLICTCVTIVIVSHDNDTLDRLRTMILLSHMYFVMLVSVCLRSKWSSGENLI